MEDNNRTKEETDEVMPSTASSGVDTVVGEITASINNINLNEEEFSEKEKHLRETLATLECPFTWKFKGQTPKDEPDKLINRIAEKIEEIEEGSVFQWRAFTLNLVICYECFRKKDNTQAKAKIKELKSILNNKDSKGPYEAFYQITHKALFHIVLASKCHLLMEDGLLNDVEQILKDICKVEEMDDPCKAALWGVKAAVSMEYGYEGTKESRLFIDEALKLDKKQGEWHFLLGKCLGRLRRMERFNEIPTSEELKALEEAFSLSKNPSYMIFLAESYREAAFKAYSLNKNNMTRSLEAKIENMNKKALHLYNEVLELRGDCSHINIRCAKGLCRLPYGFRDNDKARQCAEKALKLAPQNAMANHVRGTIYQIVDNDNENAKKYYKIAGDLGAYGAFMDFLKLEYQMDNSFDPIPEMEKMFSINSEKPRSEDLLAQMGGFYVFIKNDFPTAYRKYWEKLTEQNPDSDKIKNFKCIFIPMKNPVNLHEFIFDEARLALSGNANCLPEEERKLYRQIVLKYNDLFKDLAKASPLPRREMILEEVRLVQQRGRRTGTRGRGRGRGIGRGRGRCYNMI